MLKIETVFELSKKQEKLENEIPCVFEVDEDDIETVEISEAVLLEYSKERESDFGELNK